jgi:pimeloyl-ACP methyl ester carboxylesterase
MFSDIMKKLFTFIGIAAMLQTSAQFAVSVTYINSFTAHQVDSALSSNGIPTFLFHLNYGVNMYKVIYNTVSWDSTPTQASGLLAVPVGTPCKVGMLSYQHEEITQKNRAPSNIQNEWYISIIAGSEGYVCVMPDYLGLGSGTGRHPFLHAHSEATAVIDMIRAAKEVVDTLGAPVNNQLFLLGYSQGGHATMAAHQLIQEQLDSVMHVTASAPMAGPYDMGGVMANLLTGNNSYGVLGPDSSFQQPYLLPYILTSYNMVYNLYAADSDMMVYPYDSTLPPYFGVHSNGYINGRMPAYPALIMQPTVLDSFINDSATSSLRRAFRANDTYNWTPNSPMHLFFCEEDSVIPFQNSAIAYQQFVQNGSVFLDSTIVNADENHDACTEFAILQAYDWLLNFAYAPPIANGITVVNCTSVDTPNGRASIATTNGNPPYTYQWSNGDTTQLATGLSAGTYYVTVKDADLCGYTDSVIIQLIVSTGMQDELLANVKVYPNPAKQLVYISNSDPSDIIKQVEMYDMEGREINTSVANRANTTSLFFGDIAPGVYLIHLKTENAKELRKLITVTY